MIGTVLNERYRLDAEIGRGGMGMVFRAHDSALERDVAVKVLSEASGLGTEARTRLLHEARAAAQLNHPNIVSVYDVGEADGSPFIVMELVEGESLHERHPETLEDVVAVARQVCSALEHAHARGLVHRDLKPENVLLMPDGTSKLSDFGLARSVASRVTSTGTIVGSVFYLAPELALGREFDGRADLYALGVMLYELTVGRLPFTADDPVAVVSQHLHAPVVPPRAKNPQIPAALDELILRLLSKNPEDRPSSAIEVSHILQEPDILDRQAIPAAELSVLERIERGRMVGRDQEMQQARDLWNKALAGEAQTLLISGEPGIGKTRLVRELITQAEVSGGQALVGSSYAEGGMPYAPFRKIIREVLRNDLMDRLTLPESVLADLLALTPELRSRYQHVPESPPLDSRTEQQRLFENLLIFHTSLSDIAPLLLVLEDAQWADSGTLFLVRHLARHTRQQRVMIVATYREMELGEAWPLYEVLLDLNRERLATRLKLARLGREKTGELLSVLFAKGISSELQDAIYRETEGNPFFIEEVCKALVESGRLYYEDGRWHRLSSMADLEIPQSVRVAIRSRARALPADSQETLCLAAILGREFDFDTLARASELDKDMLLDALESAERAQLIQELREGGGGSFAFGHPLIPTTLVEGLRTVQRRRLHLRVATAIEALHPDDFEALAYHYAQAGNSEKATDYLLQAGDRARTLYACQEAADHYQRALELLEEQGEDEPAARTLMKLGLVYTAAFEPDKARRAYDEAFTLWESLRESTDFVEPAVPGRVLRFAVEEPLTLDPGMMADDISSFIAAQLFEGLVEVDLDYNVLPAAAARWDVADRGRRYVFRLREGLRWSDGAPLTAGDFEYAWKRNLSPTSRSPMAHLLYVIENARGFGESEVERPETVGVSALDDLTLQVCLQRPTAYLPHLLAHPVAYPLPRWAVQGYREAWTKPDDFVSNGAYQLEEWLRGERIVLRKNPAYQGRFPGNAERVVCPVFTDFGPVLEAYAADNLDGISMVSPDPGTVARVRTAHGRELVLAPQASTFYLVFRTDLAPFDDVRVRQAFVHAVDREALVREIPEGDYLPATGGFVPPAMPGHSTGIALTYDPEQARDLLGLAGYPGGQSFPQVAWVHFSGSADEPIVAYLHEAWHTNLGLDLQAQSLEWGAFMERLNSDPAHLTLLGWSADYPDPDAFLRVLFHSTEGTNDPRWHSTRFDGLVEEAARATDQARRMELYREADRVLVAEEAVVMPLGYRAAHILVKPWVSMPRVPPALMRLKHFVVQREDG